MTQQGDVRASSAPAMPGAARGFIRWVCTKNPFYVLSAGLFLAGLKISFGDPTLAEDTWFMMGGLAGYALLLAGAACLLVRYAKVWDDVRTVLLLVSLGANTLSLTELVAPQPLPLLAVAAVQLAVGVARWASWRCVLGSLAAVAVLAPMSDALTSSLQGTVAVHLALTAMLVLAAFFDDWFARLLRVVGVGLLILLSAATMFGAVDAGVPPWALWIYPLGAALVLVAYGLLLRLRFALAGAGVVFALWLITTAGQGYVALRQRVAGLDFLVGSLLLLAVAVLISLSKSGALTRWRPAWRGAPPPAVD